MFLIHYGFIIRIPVGAADQKVNHMCLHLALSFLEHLTCHTDDFFLDQFIETNSLKDVIWGNESDIPSLISWEGSVRMFDTLTFIIHTHKPWFFMPAIEGLINCGVSFGADDLSLLRARERLDPPPDLWKRTRCSFTPPSPGLSSSSCRLHVMKMRDV